MVSRVELLDGGTLRIRSAHGMELLPFPRAGTQLCSAGVGWDAHRDSQHRRPQLPQLLQGGGQEL